MSDNKNKYMSYRKDLAKIKSRKTNAGIIDKDVAESLIVEHLTAVRKRELDEKKDDDNTSIKNLTKDDLRKAKDECREEIVSWFMKSGYSIRGYKDDKVSEFIEEMVSEYGGYSILDEAFDDPDVDDIFCIEWNKIFVEKNNENVRYWKNFKSKEHYKTVIERFLRINGQEINVGDNKIVDTELYGDRICATSNAVSPKDFSITIRKHKEDHIVLDQLLEWGVMNEEMSEFFKMIIDGEMNFIYAGLTGSGKTTTVRALLDKYVTENGKRMLVCEDTQELFPRNEHTLELVSSHSEKKHLSIPLEKLIITALRLKPKYIVVGEVRGLEAQAAVEAMETGHSTIFTMHGGNPWNIINRLVTKYLMAMPSLGIDVVERIIGAAVDYIAIQDNIPEIGRVISGIFEISYNFDERRVNMIPIFEYDFVVKDFVLRSRIDDEKVQKLLRRGIDLDYLQKWAKTDDDKKEEEFIKEFNAKYQAEKPERIKMYEERQIKREEEKLKQHSLEKVKKDSGDNLNMAVIQEQLKSQELEEMVRKAEALKNLK